MVGDKFDFRFLTNAPGTPKWALIRSAPIELTLASIDALSRIETDIDSVAVFFAPLPRMTSVNSLVHVSHFRNLIRCVSSGFAALTNLTHIRFPAPAAGTLEGKGCGEVEPNRRSCIALDRSHEIANKEYKMHWDKEGLDPFDMVRVLCATLRAVGGVSVTPSPHTQSATVTLQDLAGRLACACLGHLLQR
jgi:hypothetical protein